MSNLGYLSNEYRNATQFAENLDKARRLIAVRGPEGLPAQQRMRLGTTLRSLVDLLDPAQAGTVDPQAVLGIPLTLVARLAEEPTSTGVPYREGLRRVADVMLAPGAPITDEETAILESLSVVAEAEAGEVFRRLVRDE